MGPCRAKHVILAHSARSPFEDMVGSAHLRARGARNRSWAFLGVLSAWSFAALAFSACPRPLSGPLLPAPARPTAVRAVGVRTRAADREGGSRLSAGAHDAETFLLESVGLTQAEVAKMFRARPWLERRSVESLRRTVQWVRGLGISDADIPRILHQHPIVLDARPETRDGMVQWLKEIGLSELEIAKLFSKHPDLFHARRSTAESTAQWLAELGFDKNSIRDLLDRAPALFHLKTANLKAKHSFLKGIGFSDAQIIQLMPRIPNIFVRSLDKNWKPRFALLEKHVSVDKLVDFVMTRGSSWLFCSMADCPDRIKRLL